MQKTLSVDGLIIEINYKQIKNLYLRVGPPDGHVRVNVPLKTSDMRIATFVRDRRSWIDKQRAFCTIEKLRYESGEMVPLWGKSLLLTLRMGRAGVQRCADGLLLTAPADADSVARERILNSFYREQLKQAISGIWESCLQDSGVVAYDWRIRDMKTRWGSCNVSQKRIWINLRLAEKSPECLRYVILHELCHLYERGHGKAFWSLMDGCCPNWRNIRKRLNGKDVPCT